MVETLGLWILSLGFQLACVRNLESVLSVRLQNGFRTRANPFLTLLLIGFPSTSCMSTTCCAVVKVVQSSRTNGLTRALGPMQTFWIFPLNCDVDGLPIWLKSSGSYGPTTSELRSHGHILKHLFCMPRALGSRGQWTGWIPLKLGWVRVFRDRPNVTAVSCFDCRRQSKIATCLESQARWR